MNIAKSMPALNSSLAARPPASHEQIAASVSDLFDAPLEARDDTKLWSRARRARQEWREQRYTRLING